MSVHNDENKLQIKLGREMRQKITVEIEDALDIRIVTVPTPRRAQKINTARPAGVFGE